jgi:hypothetical protein
MVTETHIGAGMINKKMYKEIQTFKRQGLSKGTIVRTTDLDPRTVARYYAMQDEDYRNWHKVHLYRDKAFHDLKAAILDVYGVNENQPLQVSSVYDYLEERYGPLPGNEQTLRHYVAHLIETEELKLTEAMRTYTKVPELPFGRQMQLDFGQYRCRSGLKLYIFAGVLSASRYKFVVFQDRPFRTLDVIRLLLDSFEYFGGRVRELVIDQDRLMVVSENGGDVIFTREFKELIEEQELDMYVCRKADPETKGKVENLVKFVKGSFLSTRDFATIEEANAGVRGWLERRANGKISQATRQIPALLIGLEREHLRPQKNSLFRKEMFSGREDRTASDKALISVLACQYQLPIRYRNKPVEIFTTDTTLFVYDSRTGREIIVHELSAIPGQQVGKRTCRRENERTIEELKSRTFGFFGLDLWKQFTRRVFETIPRYARDQSLEAQRSFAEREIDPGILEQALTYCLENNTPSFGNLKDTYVHFERESRRREPDPAVCKSSVVYPALNVSHRSVADYEEAIRERVVS